MPPKKRTAAKPKAPPTKRAKRTTVKKAPPPPPPPPPPPAEDDEPARSGDDDNFSVRSAGSSVDGLVDFAKEPLPEPASSTVAQETARDAVDGQLGAVPSVEDVRDVMVRYMETYAAARQQRLKEQQHEIGMDQLGYH